MNRSEYMASLPPYPSPESHAHHRAYWAQLVNDAVKREVAAEIGIDRLLASTDRALNDIPLAEWDRIGGGGSGRAHHGDSRLYFTPHWLNVPRLRELGEAICLSTTVCIAKEAARQLVEAHRAAEKGEAQ